MLAVAALLSLAAAPVKAVFHLWEVNELYSNADGSVQFIELFNSFNGEQFVQGETIESRNSDGSVTKSFTFPHNTPSGTANRHLLLATPGFGDLPGGVEPDYTIPEEFLFTDGGVVDFINAAGRMEYASLPTDGIKSRGPDGMNEENSPQNFAGETGSVGGDKGGPSVEITSPQDGATFTAPASVQITAEAGADVETVEFFENGTSLGSDSSSPYSVSVTLEAGSYMLTATATDDQGQTETSAGVNITVQEDSQGQRIDNPIEETIPKGDRVIELELVADGMTAPLGIAQPDDSTGRLFIYDQAGQIHIVEGGVRLSEPLLDVSDRLVPLGISGPNSFDERGLLGLALHPDFPDTPKLYTYTSEPVSGPGDFSVSLPEGEEFDHQSVISEWQIDPADANRVDPGTRRELMRIDQPQFNHDGGTIRFGPDNSLYVALGDGGEADDQGVGHVEGGNSQALENIYGTIVRIDVDGNNSANGEYGIPDANPFVGMNGLDEIFAYGLRNPFQFSFDRQTGQLWAADVGQNDVEEIDIITSGGNFGWNIKEGTFFFDPNGEDAGFVTTQPVREVPPDLIDPIAEYDHDDGVAVIGGFVYRGEAIPELLGTYVFGEHMHPETGRLFFLDAENNIKEFQIGSEDRGLGIRLKGFGEDLHGELCVGGNEQAGPFGDSGKLFRIVPASEAIVITSITVEDGEPGMVQIEWEGGSGPYILQRKAKVTDAVWMNAAVTAENSAEVLAEAKTGFFRVVDTSGPATTVFSTSLSGEAERPDPVESDGTGMGLFLLEGDQLSFSIQYEGLSGAATAAHIHGAASAEEAAGVLIDLEPFNGIGFGESGTLAGSVTVTAEQRSALLDSRTYVNIHTEDHAPGEIRGQIAPVLMEASLSGAAERPDPVETSGSGSGTFLLVGNELTFNITYSDLSGSATAAHIHGPASEDEAAGVLIGLGDFNGPGFGVSGTLSGSVDLTPDQLAAVVDGRTYVNIHTDDNPGGELRGQILATTSAVGLSAALSGEAERPDPVDTAASGSGSFSLQGNILRFNIEYSGLTGAASAAHIHGRAPASEAAGVMIDLEPFNGAGFGTSGTFSGSVVLTPEQKAAVLAGETYVNVHTQENPGGELRGQIVPVLHKVVLSGEAERPDPVDTSGHGFGLLALVGNDLTFVIRYQELSTDASAAHIHGPATVAEGAPVLVGLGAFNGSGFGANGRLAGSTELDAPVLIHVIGGLTYVNVHSSSHSGGEVRGQVLR